MNSLIKTVLCGMSSVALPLSGYYAMTEVVSNADDNFDKNKPSGYDGIMVNRYNHVAIQKRASLSLSKTGYLDPNLKSDLEDSLVNCKFYDSKWDQKRIDAESDRDFGHRLGYGLAAIAVAGTLTFLLGARNNLRDHHDDVERYPSYSL